MLSVANVKKKPAIAKLIRVKIVGTYFKCEHFGIVIAIEKEMLNKANIKMYSKSIMSALSV